MPLQLRKYRYESYANRIRLKFQKIAQSQIE
jgi:hypothetical protein